MAKNLVNRGRIFNVNVGGTGAGYTSGSPIMLGRLAGVLVCDADAANTADVEFDRELVVYDLSVKAIDNAGNTTIAVGDDITYTVGDSPRLSKKAAGKQYGVAFEANAGAGTTTTIQVAVVAE